MSRSRVSTVEPVGIRKPVLSRNLRNCQTGKWRWLGVLERSSNEAEKKLEICVLMLSSVCWWVSISTPVCRVKNEHTFSTGPWCRLRPFLNITGMIGWDILPFCNTRSVSPRTSPSLHKHPEHWIWRIIKMAARPFWNRLMTLPSSPVYLQLM